MNRYPQTDFPTAIILAGGLGTRLRAIYPNCPKPMIPFLGRPFIEYVVRHFIQQGITDIVISTGYKADQIEDHFTQISLPATIRCIREEAALGTGGAIAYILSRIVKRERILIANGDSLSTFDLRKMLAAMRPGIDGVMAGAPAHDSERFGTLAVDQHGILMGFHEKKRSALPSLVNCGIYLLKCALFSAIPPGIAASLEFDCFPQWLREGRRIAVMAHQSPFIDIGTPESLGEVEGFLQHSGIIGAYSKEMRFA